MQEEVEVDQSALRTNIVTLLLQHSSFHSVAELLTAAQAVESYVLGVKETKDMSLADARRADANSVAVSVVIPITSHKLMDKPVFLHNSSTLLRRLLNAREDISTDFGDNPEQARDRRRLCLGALDAVLPEALELAISMIEILRHERLCPATQTA